LKKILLFFILIFLCFSCLYFFFWRETEEDRIKENLKLLSQTISKKKEEGPPALLTKIQTIKGLSMPEILIDMKKPVSDRPVYLLRGIDEVTGLYFHAFQLVDWIEVWFYGISVEIKEGDTSALAAMTVDSLFLEHGAEESVRDVRDVEMSFQKIDDEWKIMRVVEVSKPEDD
jgi:hypothetical protein